VVPGEADQFNRLHPALVAALAAGGGAWPLHAAASTQNVEDQVWARYIADCARQAGRDVRYLPMEDIGVGASERLVDHAGAPIRDLVRAYQLNLLLREPFGRYLTAPAAPRLIEPFWKLVLTSKGSFVWLWRLFPGHPNLLPCWFERDPGAPVDGVAIKPLFSIKGYNVTLRDRSLPDGAVGTDGPYGVEGYVVQRFAPLPTFGDSRCHASVSTWIVGDRPEGLGVLESDGPIVNDLCCRFVPHMVGAWDRT
jgi:glutathionylspermidine synthase